MTTTLTGLLGYPVAHSHSPAMHQAAAAALGIDLTYIAMPVPPDDLPAAVRGLCALGFRGANVTVPHKQAVLPLMDDLSDAARTLGAVNTIVIERPGDLSDAGPAVLRGHNTDWSGFLADLDALDIPVDGRDCLVLGAGGSARAVVYALAASRRVRQAVQPPAGPGDGGRGRAGPRPPGDDAPGAGVWLVAPAGGGGRQRLPAHRQHHAASACRLRSTAPPGRKASRFPPGPSSTIWSIIRPRRG